MLYHFLQFRITIATVFFYIYGYFYVNKSESTEKIPSADSALIRSCTLSTWPISSLSALQNLNIFGVLALVCVYCLTKPPLSESARLMSVRSSEKTSATTLYRQSRTPPILAKSTHSSSTSPTTCSLLVATTLTEDK